VLPTAPSSNDAAKKERNLAIAGSYAVNNELLPQSQTFISKQQSFTANYASFIINKTPGYRVG